MVIIVHNKLRA